MRNIKSGRTGFAFILFLILAAIFVYLFVNPEQIDNINNQLAPNEAPNEETPNSNFTGINFTGRYPNSTLTPGDVMSTNWSIVCADGYSTSVRDVSESKKKEVYARYGVAYPPPTGSYECDHFIPLSIGGSNELTNLWPEAEEPRPGFREKDVVEAALHRAVCHEKLITLEEAQAAIVSDWYKVYVDYGYAIKDVTPTEEDN